MSNNQCNQSLAIRSHQPIHNPSRSDCEAIDQVYGLSISNATDLAQFLQDQQTNLQLPTCNNESAIRSNDTAPVSTTNLREGNQTSHKVLLGFHNLGHFLDWLEAQESKPPQISA
mgnify:CR=1 FL=1